MEIKKIASAVCALLATLGAAGAAHAQFSGGVVRIGFVSDMSSLYADIDGPGGAEAVKMAVEDFGGKVGGVKIEVLAADHQNKPDIAASKVREWFDTQGLDTLVGGSNSGANIAMGKVATEKKRPFFVVGGISSTFTGEQCSPYTMHWALDTYALAKGTGTAVVKAGGKTWYFLTADYAFGHQLQSDASKVVEASGGKVVGAVRVPLNASDFSSFLLQAQGSKADILALANAGGDTTNSVKAAKEFGLTKNMKLAGLLVFINDIHALGLQTTQDMYLTDAWYWNQNAESRTWARRFFSKFKRMPSSVQAGDYSATLQYLNAVKAVGSDDPAKVMAHLRTAKFNDMFMKNGWLRADGRVVHDMYLMQVKKPSESTEPWDYYKVIQTFKGEEAWTPKNESKCPLWK